MRINALVLAAGWLSGAVAAQDIRVPPVRYPRLPARAADIRGFVPSGWRLERQARGDLNGDGAPDLAFTIRMTNPRNVLRHDGLGTNPFDSNPRILAMALAERSGGYRLAFENHVLIPRPTMPTQEDPFGEESDGLRVASGALRVSLHRFMNAGGWDMGSTHFTFRWQNGAARLIGFDYDNVQRNTGCASGLSINYATRRLKMSWGGLDDDRESVRWRSLPPANLLTIERVGDGLEFDPGGAIDRIPGCLADPRD